MIGAVRKKQQQPAAPSVSAPRSLPRKLIAVVLWGFATYTTGVMLHEAGLHDLYYLVPAAIILQGAFSAMEHDVWRGRLHLLGLLAFLLDVLSNAAGVWFLVVNIEQTSIYQMLQQVFSEVPAEVPTVSKFGFAVVVGTMLAFSPESVWK
ncbi:MAG: hypothetical protein HC884_00960 [Chloroflexaceae bacterium]|nr:hypothetical protein [Chloroflexaceae bacterium]